MKDEREEHFKMKVSEWRGRVDKGLEVIEKNQGILFRKLEKMDEKMDARADKCEEDVSNLRAKVAKNSGVIALIVSAFVSALGFLIKKVFG